MTTPRDADPRPVVSMALISMIMAITALGVDLLLPAFDDIRAAFSLGEDSTGPALLLTTYFLGLSVAQLVWGPLADHFGRKRVLYAALGVYCTGAMIAGLAPTFPVMLAARVLWGVGAAGTRVVAVAIIRDLYEGDRMAIFMSRIMAIFLLVPIFAPLLAAGVLQVAPWRWLFWLTVLLAVALGVWALKAPETLPEQHRLPLRFGAIGAAFRRTLTTPVTLAYTLATVFMQGAFASYLASSELVLDTVFDRGDQFPIVFASVAGVLGLATLTAARLVKVLGGARMVLGGLWISVGLTTALTAVSLAGGGRPAFWIFMPLLTAQLALHVGLMPTLNSLALVPMGDIAGTATSVTGALRVAGGGVFGAVIDRMISGTVTPWATGFLVGAVASLVAVSTLSRSPQPPSH